MDTTKLVHVRNAAAETQGFVIIPCRSGGYVARSPIELAHDQATSQDDPPSDNNIFHLVAKIDILACSRTLTLTGGNVFVALAPVSTSATSLANETLVTALAYR